MSFKIPHIGWTPHLNYIPFLWVHVQTENSKQNKVKKWKAKLVIKEKRRWDEGVKYWLNRHSKSRKKHKKGKIWQKMRWAKRKRNIRRWCKEHVGMTACHWSGNSKKRQLEYIKVHRKTGFQDNSTKLMQNTQTALKLPIPFQCWLMLKKNCSHKGDNSVTHACLGWHTRHTQTWHE